MNTTLYSVRLSRRTPNGSISELATERVSLAPDATPAAVEAVAVKQAQKHGVPAHLVTDRQVFRLRGVTGDGAEVWSAIARSGSNDAGFDVE